MKPYAEYKAMVETALPEALPKETPLNARLLEACRYALLAEGKRLRPVLVLAATDYAGGDLTKALPFALAAECIHAYSLVHDDLPAMDNDTLRRGKPTCHVAYGEGMAILVGDALLNRAFELMSRGAFDCEGRERRALNAMGALAGAAGIDGMVGGQALDLLAENNGLDMEPQALLTALQRGKTTALFRGCVFAGLLLGEADRATLRAFTLYALAFGEAFQVADDILDAVSTPEMLGKSIGKDAQEGKLTAVSLYGLEGARKRLQTLTAEAEAALAGLPGTEFFTALARQMAARALET